jgi:hypothetical protein
MVEISDVFRYDSETKNVDSSYIYEHLYYFTNSVKTAILSDLNQQFASWNTLTWQRQSQFDAMILTIFSVSRRAFISDTETFSLHLYYEAK